MHLCSLTSKLPSIVPLMSERFKTHLFIFGIILINSIPQLVRLHVVHNQRLLSARAKVLLHVHGACGSGPCAFGSAAVGRHRTGPFGVGEVDGDATARATATLGKNGTI